MENPHHALRVPFSQAYAHINGPLSKFAPKATPCVMLGNDLRRSCYRLLRLQDMTVIFSRDVTCNENVFPFRKSDSDPSIYNGLFPGAQPANDALQYPAELLPTAPVSEKLSSRSLVRFSPGAKTLGFDPSAAGSSQASPTSDAAPRRSERIRKLSWKEPLATSSESTLHVSEDIKTRVSATEFDTIPSRHVDDVTIADDFHDFMEDCLLAAARAPAPDDSPRNFNEAMARADAPSWRDACEKEMRSHIEKHKTLAVAIVPKNSRVTGWCFKRKQNSHSGDFSYKARLVVRGNRMVPPEFGETFAPVARWVSLRTLLAIATQFDFCTESDNVETAFLMAEMDTEVFVLH